MYMLVHFGVKFQIMEPGVPAPPLCSKYFVAREAE